MQVGTLKEVKDDEHRVGLTPSGARELTRRGHRLLVQAGAGLGIGASDESYAAAGATIVPTAAAVFAEADIVVKVKEPQTQERAMLRAGQVLFTYLHLAPDPEQARDLLASGAICIAYETVTSRTGGLPLLQPMSAVAGRMSIQAGALALQKSNGGQGLLLGGVPGVLPARIVVLGGGVVGSNAVRIAAGMGADVTVLDTSLAVLQRIDAEYGGRVKTLHSTAEAIMTEIRHADLVIGGVLTPGAAAPKLITRAMLRDMRPGAALVDVAIDQGGCFETSRPTTHSSPIFVVDGIVHYCVANMPGGVARTSTFALENATLPFIVSLAHSGWRDALAEDENLRSGLNVALGEVTHPAVAESLGYAFTDPRRLLAA
jgi:alanine dehydrogenase